MISYVNHEAHEGREDHYLPTRKDSQRRADIERPFVTLVIFVASS